MKHIKIILVLCMCIGIAFSVGSVAAEGEDSVIYTLSEDRSTLTISAMTDFDLPIDVDWKDARTSITSVIVSDGITKIGSYAFYGCSALTDVKLPETLTTIGDFAFQGCVALEKIEFPANLRKIGYGAFYGCEKLSVSGADIANVSELGKFAFMNCLSAPVQTAVSVKMQNDVTADGGISGTVSIDGNYSGKTFLIAAYNGNGHMTEVQIKKQEDIADGKIAYTLQSDNTKKIKTFAIEDVTSITPLCEPSEYTFADENTNEISCWGDSLTFGEGAQYDWNTTDFDGELRKKARYTAVLAALSGRTVNNYGVGGENTLTIAARQGSIPMVISEQVTIPADTSKVSVKLESSYVLIPGESEIVKPLQQKDVNGSKELSCSLGGIVGTLSYDAESSTYYFNRTTAGSETEIAAKTQIIADASEAARGDITVIFTGQNDNQQWYKYLIPKQKAMINYLNSENPQYVVIGLSTGTRDQRKSNLEDYQAAEFGANYLNIRDYLSKYGVYEAYDLIKDSLSDDEKNEFVTKIDESLETMETGKVPALLLRDKVHFNATGYRVIGRRLFEKMVELGYLDGVTK